MKVLRLLIAALLMACGAAAQAVVIDFIALTESGGYGESAWNPLVLSFPDFNVTITGTNTGDNDATQYAYLDWGRAGLGVCSDVTGGAGVKRPGNGGNLCSPSSDDNVTWYEAVHFVFSQDVVVENFWFNNNHDGGFGAGDKVTIAGSQYDLATGYAGGANGIGSFVLAAGKMPDVAFYNEQFYISGMELHAVPEPATFGLLGAGLVCLAFTRRRKI